MQTEPEIRPRLHWLGCLGAVLLTLVLAFLLGWLVRLPMGHE